MINNFKIYLEKHKLKLIKKIISTNINEFYNLINKLKIKSNDLIK